MAKEYIERGVLALKVRRYLMPNVDIDGTVSVEDAERYFLKLLDSQPTADVVEVVRCKDCRNFGEDVGMSKDGVWARCLLHGRIMCERDFCSYGEKMDGKDGEGK